MSTLQPLQFYFMHFMPYPDVVPDRPQGQWVDIPNMHFDARKGHKLYKDYIDELVLGDKLGYDGLVVNEHHATFYSMMPSCSVIAGALAILTERAKICVFGTPIALTYPHRLAEEYAMLDVMSGGRLECAFPLGTGMEYWVNPINPSFSRDRFREGMDILMQAWTQPGPSRYDGEFYQYKYLNPFPLPYQKPRPKIYIVGSGTEETVNYAAEKGYGYSQVFTPIAGQLKSFENYRATATKNGQKHDSETIIISAMAFVAETEEKGDRRGQGTHPLLFQEPSENRLSSELAAWLSPGRPAAETLGIRGHPGNGSDLGGFNVCLPNGARHSRPGSRTHLILVRTSPKQQGHSAL